MKPIPIMKRATAEGPPFRVVDLFSGGGGMSLGFKRHPSFAVIAAADAEFAKPSARGSSLQCNRAYYANIGIEPKRVDLSRVSPGRLREVLGLPKSQKIHVLSACPPCTGFSRANPLNHLRDDGRNSLVKRSALFALALEPDIVVMENARELIRGNFGGHYKWFSRALESHGYRVCGRVYMLSRFGLPQFRERAIVIAVREGLQLQTLDSLWEGWRIRVGALTVQRAFLSIPATSTGLAQYPKFASALVADRLAAIPPNGGSWADLIRHPQGNRLMTDSMKRILAAGKIGSHPDVYGRMAWDRPAPTIKRECAHIGNGRYAHPEEPRLCSVREMATLQGFPTDHVLAAGALSNTYRHIGDAVPPLVSYQIAHLCAWIETGIKPCMADVILPGTHLVAGDLVRLGEDAHERDGAVGHRGRAAAAERVSLGATHAVSC
jgi:DNA (cytosine-5)-methyltransferase 1